MRRSSILGLVITSAGLLSCGPDFEPETTESVDFHRRRIPNNEPWFSRGGLAASFSTEGYIDKTNAFFTPQGTNGRDCATCHLPHDGWSITPETARHLFNHTDGTHPLFNILDANTPTSDVSTVEARRSSYSMLLQGKFVRLRSPPANREFDVIAANDPFNFGTTARLLFFRRPLPTANFQSVTVMWDSANTTAGDLHEGLRKQARGNVTGAQQGPAAAPEVIEEIVNFELSVTHAQVYVHGAGLLNAGGARGGPEALAAQPMVAGPFDVFDAWTDHHNWKRAKIARGQALFNNVNVASGKTCGGCHNAANNGQNVNGSLFNVGTSNPEFARADMAIYTLQNRATGEIKETTDPGRAFGDGLWASINRFKTPNLRGLASRAPYFHNGIAETLHDVVIHYEVALGFDFTPSEESDLVAFLGAL